jgi:tRNA pseudouridine13 synthase
VTYLVDHPADFKGAFARLRRELRSLYFAAFQSHLWNLILAGWIERNTREEQRSPVELKVGVFPFPTGLDEDQRDAIASAPLPLPSSRNRPGGGPVDEITTDVLAAFGLAWNDMRVKHLKDVFFSKGSRDPLLVPEGVRSEILDDDLHRNKRAIRLSFDLPKGAYATILVKRITEAAEAGS